MPSNSSLSDVVRALGDLALLADGGPCMSHRSPLGDGTHPHGHATLKSASGSPMAPVGTIDMLLKQLTVREQEDINAMLLSLVLDLWRRSEYMYLAFEGFAPAADESRAARIAAHHAVLDPIDGAAEVDWKARAKACSVILHRLLAIVEPSHIPAMDNAVSSAAAKALRDQERDETLAQIRSWP